MPSIKYELLVGIHELGTVNQPKDLQPYAANGVHSIIHVLWRLQKQGLISMTERKVEGRPHIPTRIQLTEAGLAALKENRP